MTDFELTRSYDPIGRPPDFSYTMTDQEVRAGGNSDLDAMETIVKRTEHETETRRERFQFIEVIPRLESMAYTIELWLIPR